MQRAVCIYAGVPSITVFFLGGLLGLVYSSLQKLLARWAYGVEVSG